MKLEAPDIVMIVAGVLVLLTVFLIELDRGPWAGGSVVVACAAILISRGGFEARIRAVLREHPGGKPPDKHGAT